MEMVTSDVAVLITSAEHPFGVYTRWALSLGLRNANSNPAKYSVFNLEMPMPRCTIREYKGS